MRTTSPPSAPSASTSPGSQANPWQRRPAEQQPQWQDHAHYGHARRELRRQEELVSLEEIDTLASAMASVAAGGAQVLQVGDCAESLYECTAGHAANKLALLDSLAVELAEATGRPVVRLGRLGGQLAKPRSRPTELHGDVELPVFRGHLVNSEQPTSRARAHDPRRMLWAYDGSAEVQGEVRRHRTRREDGAYHSESDSGPWSSHEALVIDYEDSLVRVDDASGQQFLGSTHFPWIGERTRQPNNGHVALLAAMRNPVACKVGPKVNVADILALCEALDPNRVPGRLTLIARMGRDQVNHVLPDLVRAVRAAGHPVVWLCDPMHGNTVTRNGAKTRVVSDLATEVAWFRAVIEAAGAHAGGLHLEMASSSVTECLGLGVGEPHLYGCYTSLCDPRLNLEQARQVLDAWAA